MTVSDAIVFIKWHLVKNNKKSHEPLVSDVRLQQPERVVGNGAKQWQPNSRGGRNSAIGGQILQHQHYHVHHGSAHLGVVVEHFGQVEHDSVENHRSSQLVGRVEEGLVQGVVRQQVVQVPQNSAHSLAEVVRALKMSSLVPWALWIWPRYILKYCILLEAYNISGHRIAT